jgi:ribosomal-protein-alanine N-acetyltransferase
LGRPWLNRSAWFRYKIVMSHPVEDTLTIRPATLSDLCEIAAIQSASPEASHWDPAGYLDYDCRICLFARRAAGFLVARHVAEDETEVLNLAVAPEFRRKGCSRALLEALLSDSRGTVYLEVRESNQAARMLYKSIGFQEVNVRPDYYTDPPEAAIVMKFHSC